MLLFYVLWCVSIILETYAHYLSVLEFNLGHSSSGGNMSLNMAAT